MPKRKKDDRVTAVDVIEFIETTCFVPEGAQVGQKLKLLDWQKAEIAKIYDNPVGTRRAIISMPRKNAKSTLCACLLRKDERADRLRATRRTASFTARRSRVIRPGSCSRWPQKWCA